MLGGSAKKEFTDQKIAQQKRRTDLFQKRKRESQHMPSIKKISASIATIAVVLMGAYKFITTEILDNHSSSPEITSTLNGQSQLTGNKIDQSVYDQLAALDFKSGELAVIDVNNGKSTLDTSLWKENRVYYGDLDELNRTTSVTAYIDKNNLGKSEGRSSQVWQPTGWNQKKVDGEMIYNRGHLLAYTSSFNFDVDGNYKKGEEGSEDNPKNLATQSAYSNQRIQTKYEALVREAQKITGNKVVYQIVTVFRGDEKMPRGYWLQAKDTKGTLDFNVYEYNVQPNVKFDYKTGKAVIDRSVKIGTE